MNKIEKIKCSKCGFFNIKGTMSCSKCHTKINKDVKSCPKCAKINNKQNKKCVSCNFNFDRKSSNILVNFVISVLLIFVLFLLVYLKKEDVVKQFSLVLKLFAGIMGFVLLIRTFTYGSKEKIKYNMESEIVSEHKGLEILKKISSMSIIIGTILVFLILIFNYFIK